MFGGVVDVNACVSLRGAGPVVAVVVSVVQVHVVDVVQPVVVVNDVVVRAVMTEPSAWLVVVDMTVLKWWHVLDVVVRVVGNKVVVVALVASVSGVVWSSSQGIVQWLQDMLAIVHLVWVLSIVWPVGVGTVMALLVRRGGAVHVVLTMCLLHAAAVMKLVVGQSMSVGILPVFEGAVVWVPAVSGCAFEVACVIVAAVVWSR